MAVSRFPLVDRHGVANRSDRLILFGIGVMTVAHDALLHHDGNRYHQPQVTLTILGHQFFMLLGTSFQLLDAFALELISGNVFATIDSTSVTAPGGMEKNCFISTSRLKTKIRRMPTSRQRSASGMEMITPAVRSSLLVRRFT